MKTSAAQALTAASVNAITDAPAEKTAPTMLLDNKKKRSGYTKARTHATLGLDELIPHPDNPRSHPADQLKRIAESIRVRGQVRDVIVRAENRVIVAGHGTVEALRALGHATADVVLWDCSQEDANAYMLADNRLAEMGHDDAQKRAKLLLSIPTGEFLSVGYTAEEVAKLIPPEEVVTSAELVSLDVTRVNDECWIMVSGPLRMQADILQRIQTLMVELPDVKVELGTTGRPTGERDK